MTVPARLIQLLVQPSHPTSPSSAGGVLTRYVPSDKLRDRLRTDNTNLSRMKAQANVDYLDASVL